MRIVVLAVGRMKDAHFLAAEAEYLGRLRHYADVEVREVKDEAALVAALPARMRLIALDETGELMTSVEIARKVVGAAEQHGGGAPLGFAVGGAEGLTAVARSRADRLLAFGKITLPHRLARIVLLEQLYRAFAILRGEPYHKG